MTNQPWAKLGETELPLASKGVTSKGRMPGRSLALFIEWKPHPWLGYWGAMVLTHHCSLHPEKTTKNKNIWSFGRLDDEFRKQTLWKLIWIFMDYHQDRISQSGVDWNNKKSNTGNLSRCFFWWILLSPKEPSENATSTTNYTSRLKQQKTYFLGWSIVVAIIVVLYDSWLWNISKETESNKLK